jgi:hypothetical protein
VAPRRLGSQQGVSSSGAMIAIIPDVIQSGSDTIGKRLNWDIIAFVFVLAGNQFVAQYFEYSLFDMS